jgi:glycosyltransferase involved in cell wall biosynthesis
MRVAYIVLDPVKSARLRKIAQSVRKCGGVVFSVMIPKVRFVWRGNKLGRLFIGVTNYLAFILQIMLVKADVFWVANCPDIFVLPVVLRKKRYVLDYRSPWALQVKQEFGSGPWARLSAIIEDIALRYAEVITLTTSKLVTRVERYGKPICVIPNYPLKSFGVTVSRAEFRRSHSVSDSEKVVLFVGRLSRVEGADMLCDIIASVLKKTSVMLWVVGDGPLYPLLERCKDKFPSNIRLFGWRPHEEIPNFINASDVCIVPRHKVSYSYFYNEEGVTKISEYMFFAKPIVACGIAGSKQYLLVDEKEMAEGIITALTQKVPSPTRKTWEDYCEKKICELSSLLRSGNS